MPANANKPTAAQAVALKKFAAADQRDAEQAFEVGFVKAAQDLGMSKEDFNSFYQIACADLQAAQKQG